VGVVLVPPSEREDLGGRDRERRERRDHLRDSGIVKGAVEPFFSMME